MIETPVDRARKAYGTLLACDAAAGRPDRTFSRLAQPKERGGSDGIVPIRMAARLVEHAEAAGAALCWDDMRPSRELLDALDARDRASADSEDRP